MFQKNHNTKLGSLVSAAVVCWIILLVLKKGPKEGMTKSEIKKSLVSYKVINFQNEPYFFIDVELGQIKADNLIIEIQENQESKFMLTPCGLQRATAIEDFIKAGS